MSELKWEEPSTLTTPLAAKRRKLAVAEQDYSREEWEAQKPRIEELYGTHELREVRTILEAEGFKASERQIRTRLEQWGTSKYLTFSADQWRYMEHKTVCRTLQNKKTAFRYKKSKKRIPSENIRRGLNRRISTKGLRGLSVCGTVSSHELSAYSSESHGFDLRGILAGPSVPPNLETMTTTAVSYCTEEFRKAYPRDQLEYKVVRPYIPGLEVEVGYRISINCRDCPASGCLREIEFSKKSFLVMAPNCPSILDSDHNKMPRAAFNPPNQGRIFSFVKGNFEAFRRDHLSYKPHRGRVLARLLKYDPDDCSEVRNRLDLALQYGCTCEHRQRYLDIQNTHPYAKPPMTMAAKGCWNPGGCCWLQLKAALDQNPSLRESVLNQETLDILELDVPIEDPEIEHTATVNTKYSRSKLVTFEELSNWYDSKTIEAGEEALHCWVVETAKEQLCSSNSVKCRSKQGSLAGNVTAHGHQVEINCVGSILELDIPMEDPELHRTVMMKTNDSRSKLVSFEGRFGRYGSEAIEVGEKELRLLFLV